MTDRWHNFVQSQASADFTGTLADNAVYGLAEYCFLHISGEDAEAFLQGQLSCDVRAIDQGRSGLGSHNNAKGRMLSSFRICRKPDGSFWLRVHHSIAETARAALAKYAVFSRAEVTVDEDIAVIGLHGDHARQRLQQLCPDMPQESYQQATVGEDAIVICTSSRHPAWEIYGTTDKLMALWPPLTDKQTVHDARQHHLLEHELGLAFIEQGSCEAFIPQMFNYQALPAISFKKGCYTGQEIIARMQYLGKLKRHLYHIHCQCDGDLTIGDPVMSEAGGKECGAVASAVQLPDGRLDALLVLTRDAASADSLFTASAKLDRIRQIDLPYQLEQNNG